MKNRLAVIGLALLLLLAATFVNGKSDSMNNNALAAQHGECSVRVEPVEDPLSGTTYYEIIGENFTSPSVELRVINKRTRTGQAYMLTLVENFFRGIYIGYDPDTQTAAPIEPGRWKIIAKSSDCVARTTLKIK